MYEQASQLRHLSMHQASKWALDAGVLGDVALGARAGGMGHEPCGAVEWQWPSFEKDVGAQKPRWNVVVIAFGCGLHAWFRVLVLHRTRRSWVGVEIDVARKLFFLSSV